jgi:iron complex transport system substrate-binding protein
MSDKPMRFFILTAVLVFVCSVGIGCRSNVIEPTKQVETRQVTDDLGRTVTIPLKITRAISLAPSITESIFAVGAGDRLVGVTTYCNYPEAAKSVAKVGDTINPNLETIVALKPDVVFVSTASQIEAFKNTIEQNDIAVYVTNPNSLFDVFRNLKQLGEICGTSENAAKLVDELQKRTTAVEWATKGREPTRVFVQISKEPLFTIGKQSFLTGVIEIAFARSVTADVETAYPKLSKETALALNPEVIILSASEDNREPNEVFRNSPAVKNGKVFSVDADLLSRPGPRLVDALELIARDLHPDKFGKN